MAEAKTLDGLLLLGTGFTISLGHCVGMCGPLVGAVSLAWRQQGRRYSALIPALLLYHLGRLGSYSLIGLAFGLLGTATQQAGQGRTIQGGLSLLAGLLMCLLGFGLLGWLPTQRWVESGRLGQAVAARFRGLLGRRDLGAALLLGAANGFLPCGPVYAVAAGTVAAASPLLGAGAMMLFGLGTVPVVLALGLGAGRLTPKAQGRFARIGALLVLLIGLQLILRGCAAFGWVPHLHFGELVIW